MPTYGYQCTQCKHEFSVFQAMKDAALTDCPQCDGTIKRLLYPVGVIFKGSGWYVNDSRPPEKGADDKASDDKASGEKPSDDKAAGAKPESDKSQDSDSKPTASSTTVEKNNSGGGEKPAASESKTGAPSASK